MEFIRGAEGGDHWRIADADDNRVATCYMQENAERLVELLNLRASGPTASRLVVEPSSRCVLGEGYGLGKGVCDGGKFKWVGLSQSAGSTDAVELTFPTVQPIIEGKIAHPETRRRFRLVLEVVDVPVRVAPSEGGAT